MLLGMHSPQLQRFPEVIMMEMFLLIHPNASLISSLHHSLSFSSIGNLKQLRFKGGSKKNNPSHLQDVSDFKMFYFSARPLKGFCSCLNRRLPLFLCGKRRLGVLCRSAMCDLTEMSRTQTTFHSRAPCRCLLAGIRLSSEF